jgi:membrane protein implicated in regulation of membrane protease activity
MIDQFLTRLAVTIAAFFAATLVGAAALAFFAYAAYLALVGAVAPPLAALCTGLGAVLLAFLIVIAARVLARGKRAPAPRHEQAGDAHRLAGELGSQLGSLTRTHKGPVLAASLLAGVAVGASPRLRRVLLDLILPR